jgi:hypothetical protein
METKNLSLSNEPTACTQPVITCKEAQDITTEEVLKLESFKGLSEEQAGELVASIKAFTQVVFFSCMGRKTA